MFTSGMFGNIKIGLYFTLWSAEKWKQKCRFFIHIFNNISQSFISVVKWITDRSWLSHCNSLTVSITLTSCWHHADIMLTSRWYHADITWFLEARADDIIKDDAAVGAAVELSAVHGQCEDPSHPGTVPAQVWELLLRGTSLQVEPRHGVRGNQTLNRTGSHHRGDRKSR